MERALLEVEHNNELKNIQNDEAKLKHLQQEHQLRIDAFNMHTSQVNIQFNFSSFILRNSKINKILFLDS
jgi:hypothetical protein